MQVRPELTALGVSDPRLLDPYLEGRRYAPGERIMAQGTPGAECYLITEGEVRLEVERPDFDSDGIIAYLGPGMLCGEFSMLDGQPRSASAYAHSEVSTLALSQDGLGRLCRDDPATGLAVLRALGRDAAAKARETRRHLEEYVFAADVEPAVDAAVARAAAAQEVLAGWPEARVEALLDGIAAAVAGQAEALAAATVAETGIGNVADKAFKNRFASLEVNRALQGRPGIGPRPPDDRGVTEIASPVGVVLGLIPMTNPVATLVFKTLICVKARNALIVSHHPAAAGVGAQAVGLIGEVLAVHGAPTDLLQSVERASRARTAMFMRHPRVALVLATGGTAMVRAAYSSGTPAIGVGSGNVPALVCADADPAAAAAAVVQSKAFDNGIICGSEDNLVVEEGVAGPLLAELERAGAAVCSATEAARVAGHAFDPGDGHLRREALGQSAQAIADAAGVRRDRPVRVLVLPQPLEQVDGPLGREKLAPLLSLFRVADGDQGVEVCKRLLANQGAGHTAVIHTGDQALQQRFAEEVPASRILVNGPATQGCIGVGNGLTPSLTLGCGTFGGNSTTDNVTYTNLLNIKRLARPLRA
ncbi:MAG TPA: aldehyde dehydrogenase family protein [Actinomycetota bacterium]|jgi:acyl-CoA reductase-like NAD-dependent aldehyde dehydrogenase|nr:aldehyde dehydrogenase family protein [Actinomycetota bacterium]